MGNNIQDQINTGAISMGGGVRPSADPVVNEDLGKIVEKGADDSLGKLAKLAEAIPIIGPLLAKMIPFNALQTPAVRDYEGWAAQKINRGADSVNVKGGLIASTVAGVFKRSEITDLVGSGIEKPIIEGLAISGLEMGSASFGDLGGLIPGPPGLPHNMGGMGMGMNA
jgi:hypothetical protein